MPPRSVPSWERLSQVWRAKHLEYTWIWAGTGRHTTFWKLAGDSLDTAIATVFRPLGAIPPGHARRKLLDAYVTLDAYPEVAGVLAQLKARGAKLAILTNGDPDMIEAAVRSAKLDGVFDKLITVHEVGVFKPHRPVYDLVSKHFGVPLAQVSFQSSNRWDVTAAKVAGMRGVWVNRRAHRPSIPTRRRIWSCAIWRRFSRSSGASKPGAHGPGLLIFRSITGALPLASVW